VLFRSAAVAQRILLAECPQATPQIGAGVMALFRRYAWPGNIRQLANVLRTAAVMAAGEPQITEDHLSDDFLEDVQRVRADAPVAWTQIAPTASNAAIAAFDPPSIAPLIAPPSAPPAQPVEATLPEPARTLGEAEIDMIRNAVEAANGNISEASKRLGISRNTIYRKLRWNQGG